MNPRSHPRQGAPVTADGRTPGENVLCPGPVMDIALAPGADENGLAVMLSQLVRQNLETNPHKMPDFEALSGVIAIVAEDAEVALTLCFDRGDLRIHDGVLGVPDVVIYGTSDTIMALSNMPLNRQGLPIPRRDDKAGQELVRSVFRALFRRQFRIEGMLFHLPMLMHLTKVMSVNG